MLSIKYCTLGGYIGFGIDTRPNFCTQVMAYQCVESNDMSLVESYPLVKFCRCAHSCYELGEKHP